VFISSTHETAIERLSNSSMGPSITHELYFATSIRVRILGTPWQRQTC